ncbi:hypothetical protein Q0Z83_110220 [Actinoplanes sichuanensis]|nr:hypothetical protein Q0Z83_110220 [Actinoplanes sichuanensis]
MDVPLVLSLVDRRKAFVELLDGVDLRDGNQVRAPETPALVLDAALLVSPLLSRNAIKRIKADPR